MVKNLVNDKDEQAAKAFLARRGHEAVLKGDYAPGGRCGGHEVVLKGDYAPRRSAWRNAWAVRIGKKEIR